MRQDFLRQPCRKQVNGLSDLCKEQQIPCPSRTHLNADAGHVLNANCLMLCCLCNARLACTSARHYLRLKLLCCPVLSCLCFLAFLFDDDLAPWRHVAGLVGYMQVETAESEQDMQHSTVPIMQELRYLHQSHLVFFRDSSIMLCHFSTSGSSASC